MYIYICKQNLSCVICALIELIVFIAAIKSSTIISHFRILLDLTIFRGMELCRTWQRYCLASETTVWP
jgi:hypothetical protein